jgi:hypothetical protein
VVSDNAVLVEIITAVSTVALKDEAPKAVVLRLVADNKKLNEEARARDEADLRRDVEEAHLTYKDVRKLSDKDKTVCPEKPETEGWMAKLARSDRKAFNEAFPPIPADQRHLLRTVTPAEPARKPEEAEKPVLSMAALTSKLMSEKKLSYLDATTAASRILSGALKLEDVGK